MSKTPNSKKHVFVMAFSSTCGHCRTFKNSKRKPLLNLLSKAGTVEVVELNLTAQNSHTLLTSNHPDLPKYIGWYPSFMLFTRSSWTNKNTKLEGFVLNGKISGDKVVFDNSKAYSVKPEFIRDWINKKLKDPMFNKVEKEKVVIVTNGDGLSGSGLRYGHYEIDALGY